MAIVNATRAILTVNGTKVANLTNLTFSKTMETRETTNKDSGGNATFLEGKKSWQMSATGYLDFEASDVTFDELVTLMDTRQTVFVVWDTETSGEKYYYGSAFITELSTEGGFEDNQTFSITLQGTGAITQASTT